ncbi:MAG: ATP-dependent DNA helicase UvrD2 [Acidimicrobiales bacterium]|nr:ATP-dependent DNA helicase UvrD2 [Acidimicrobiales bacterium]
MDAQRILDGLDPAQRRAVTETTHPLAILAGAGSGKTRVLTRRIAYRCATGDADPRHVLAVTFTRKAAAELDSRLRAFGLRDLPTAGTFHALALAQLRPIWQARSGGMPTVLSRKGRLLGNVLGNTRRMSPADLASEIEWARARLVTPDHYADAVARHGRPVPVDPERIADWYRRYQQEKRRRGVVDFDDMLSEAADVIERNPTVASAQRWRFRHLFVDEYQDVNPLQERLLRAWLGDRPDLCVVGDPNQAIYGWNGADADLLRRFQVHHPGAAVVELTDSYRSSPQILAAAARVLDDPRTLAAVSHRPDGPVPSIVGYRSDLDEANGVARAVRDNHRPGGAWSRQAVLVRTNAQAALLETALRRASIPYRMKGNRKFLDEPDVRDLLDRLTRLREPLSTTIADLRTSVDLQREAALADLTGPGADTSEPPTQELLESLHDTAVGRRLAAFDEVIRLGEEALATDPGIDSSAFPDWLRTVLLDDDPTTADAVTIASFHAAKGLEWEVVHLAGLEDGFVPISHARTPEAQDEEVRLLYVAVTRAASVLRCSWAATRTFGEAAVTRKPSPFLARIGAATRQETTRAQPALDAATRVDSSRSALRRDPAVAAAAEDAARVRAVEEAIRRWRDEQARKARVRPSVVLADRAVSEIAKALPADLDTLGRVAGMGPVARERHGRTILAIVDGAVASTG